MYWVELAAFLLPFPLALLMSFLHRRGRPWGDAEPDEIQRVRVMAPLWALVTLLFCTPLSGSVALDLGEHATVVEQVWVALPVVLDGLVAAGVLDATTRLARRRTGASRFARNVANACLAFHVALVPVVLAAIAWFDGASGSRVNWDDMIGFMAAVVVFWALPGVAIGRLLRSAATAFERAASSAH